MRKVRNAASREEALAAFRAAERLLDRAARKNLIHRNTAARYKSRLYKIASSKS
jgi:small subunit ribosomal protein S20